ncbi:MAG: prolipoprotein diacylglyceryl transferase [Thermoguttaceae bacterium]|nr:prolipoprotein diacylglyceryl transferase [Thermoguttaceae bacterium]
MKQTLFYLPTEIFDLPLFGAGLLFWLILLLGAVSVLRSLLRKRSDDALFYATITALGVFIVRVVGPRIAESGGFPIRGYGVFLTLAIALSTLLTIWRAKRRWNYPADAILGIVFVAAFCGICGARLFYVVEYWPDVRAATFGATLINIVDVTNGGLVVYGSILGGIAAVVAYLALKKLPILATLDLFAPALLLGVSIGRIGCLMNGCCFGGPCDAPWGIVFPAGSPAHQLQMEEGATSLYGLTLALPETSTQTVQTAENAKTSQTADAKKDVLPLKGAHKNLATETFAPVYVAAVDAGSAAEEAGIVPGARICELGLVPRGLLAADAKARRAEIRRYRPKNNAQVFYFFLHIWAGSPDFDVWAVVQDPPTAPETSENAQTEKNEPPQTDDATAKTDKTVSTASPGKLREIVFRPAPSTARPVHPTQLYSSTTAFLLCLVLLGIARVVKRDGLVFASLLILYPINRFCLELIRVDEESFLGTGLTVSQCVSLGLLAVGLALFVWLKATPPRQALAGFFPTSPTSPDSPETPETPTAAVDKTAKTDK